MKIFDTSKEAYEHSLHVYYLNVFTGEPDNHIYASLKQFKPRHVRNFLTHNRNLPNITEVNVNHYFKSNMPWSVTWHEDQTP